MEIRGRAPSWRAVCVLLALAVLVGGAAVIYALWDTGSLASGELLVFGQQPKALDAAAATFGEFSTVDLDGNTVTNEIFKGHKITLVNVWATFCGPCIKEMPELEEISHERDSADVLIIGICGDLLDPSGNINDSLLAKARDIADNSTGVTYTCLAPSAELKVGILSDVFSYPTTFIVDEDGSVLDKTVGARDKAGWLELIDKYTAEESAK